VGVTLGLVSNVYNEVNALPGWLETHLPFFDDVRVYHAGPRGELSSDGTMELLKKWGVPVKVGSIDEGFGVVRTKAVRSSPCDYVMILDADERFFPLVRDMLCSGTMNSQEDVDLILRDYDFRAKDSIFKIPNWENIRRLGSGLTVRPGPLYNQGGILRGIIECNVDVVTTIRRHWHDFSMRRPTQDWTSVPDYQSRIVKNTPGIYFNPSIRMHERLEGCTRLVNSQSELFFDHFHFTFKAMEPAQRAHDCDIYDAIHAGRTPPTWEERSK
jgi:glycosyltransferase involved in cell wall biosynthesis